VNLEKLASVISPDTTANVAPKDDPKKVKESAKQFEALLIGQMMKSMRDSEGGWLGTGEDQAGDSAMEYAQENFAQSLANSGGLGLSSTIVKAFQKSNGS
jgi:flagellar protein FlgJ